MAFSGSEAVAHSPGKLIVSGEHSVLYGAPALAMAVARYTEVWFKPVGLGEGLRTAFANLSDGVTYPLAFLQSFKSKLDRRFDQFARGELQVHKVLSHPDDLAVFTLATLLHEKPTEVETIPGFGAMGQLPAPGELGSRSDLPIGAGMGSSAAVVAATTILFETLLQKPKTPEERYTRVRFCERLKHGKAGPIDASSVVYGGLLRVPGPGQMAEPLTLDDDHSLFAGAGWYWVLHGSPFSVTGECVSAVAEAHGQDRPLWDAFADCTKAIEHALTTDADPRAVIKENQRLLERIGVVPDETQRLIAEVEALEGAAKICGAGAVRGDQGGAVLVYLPDAEAMSQLMARRANLNWGALQVAPAGAAPGPAPRQPRIGDGA